MEKRIAKLRSEFLLMNHVLREEMVAELQEELRELVPEETRGGSQHYTRLDQKQRMTSRWLRKIEEQYRETTEEDEEDEAKSPDLETLSFNFSETSSDSNNIDIMMKLLKHELEDSSKVLLDVSSDGDTSDGDTSDDDTSDGDTSSQPAKCEQEENQWISSDVATVTDTSQLMKEESSRNPVHANPSFIPEELRSENQRVQVDRTKEEEALLMEREWKEWMDKQEMRGNHKVKPVDRKNTEKQGGAAPPVPKKENAKQNTKQKQNVKHIDTMKKIKTYLSDLFNPHTFNKWERFEDED